MAYWNIDNEFDKSWWEILVAFWNESEVEVRRKMAGAGAIIFEVEGGSATCVEWDLDGFARVRSETIPNAPLFRASPETWRSFVNREIGAAAAVVLGKIAYHGAISRILRFVRGFDAVADVAKRNAL